MPPSLFIIMGSPASAHCSVPVKFLKPVAFRSWAWPRRFRDESIVGAAVYEAYYKLARRPFLETVSPLAYVELPSREVALRRLRYGLEHSRGPTVLFGPPGAGKTLLALRLASELGVAPIHLTF